jgi:hypothetical protein
MDKKAIPPFLMGIFVGLILLSMYFSKATSIELTSILIALLAIFLTISTLRDSKLHNRLSVKPILTSTIDLSNGSINITFHNKGLGTALFKDICYLVDGEIVKPIKFADMLQEYIKIYGSTSGSKIALFFDDYSLGKDQSAEFYNISFNNPVDTYEMNTKLNDKFKLIIRYECIYGIEYTYET